MSATSQPSSPNVAEWVVAEVICHHGAAAEPHEWKRPDCPAEPVGRRRLAVGAQVQVDDDAPGVMAILLAAGGAAAQPRRYR